MVSEVNRVHQIRESWDTFVPWDRLRIGLGRLVDLKILRIVEEYGRLCKGYRQQRELPVEIQRYIGQKLDPFAKVLRFDKDQEGP